MEANVINYLPKTSGLYLYIPNDEHWRQSYLPCSLASIKVKASIVDMVSRVTLSQTFSNDNARIAHEALYRFPLYENSAVCEFHMEHSGRKLLGIVKAEEEATKTYETAKAQGKTAALVLQKEPDVFQTKVGNIPPKTAITVTLTYITPLKQDTESGAIRFTIPTVISPRYGIHSNFGSSNVKTTGMGFELSLDTTMPSDVTSVSSPSHPIAMTLSSSTSAQVTLSNTSPVLDKDIVILVTAKDVDEPRCVIETHPATSTKCAMLNLVPKFNLPRASTEVIFIIDRSGSMQDKVDTLKRALQIFLKSLPASPDIYFNICSFGSRFDFLFKDGKSKKYDSKTLQTAEDYVSKVDANYGGTEILNPLVECMEKRRTDCQTTIILLTDGQVYNTDAIISSIAQEKVKNLDKCLRIFSLGIGDAVSHHLIEGIARAGGGYSQLVMNQERLDRKVVRMLSAGLQAPLKDLHLDWPEKPSPEQMVYKLVKADSADEFEVVDKQASKQASTSFFDKEADDTDAMKFDPPPESRKATLDAPTIQQFPEAIPPLYNVSRHVMFLLFPSSHPTPQDVTLNGTTPDGALLSLKVPVTEISTDYDSKPIIHTLAARTLLGELQEGRLTIQQNNSDDLLEEAVKQEGIRVGVKYGLASKWTGFVAVDEQKADEKTDENTDEMRNQYPHQEVYARGESFYVGSVESNTSFGDCGPVPPAPRFSRSRSQSRKSIHCATVATSGSFLSGSPESESVQEMSYCALDQSRAPIKARRAAFSASSVFGMFSKSGPKSSSYAASATTSPPPPGACSVDYSHVKGKAIGIAAGARPVSATPALSNEQKLHEIVMQQSSSGMFPSNVTLAHCMDFDSVTVIKDKLPAALKTVLVDIWMTVLVCVFLELKLADEKEAWELVVEKAWAYVASNVEASKVAELRKAAGDAIAA